MSILKAPSIHLSKNAKDISGHKFGELTAIKPIGRQGPNVVWACSCICGGEKAVIAAQLKAGKVKSCGCLLTTPVHSAFVGPKQPRINKGKLTQEAKRQRSINRKLLKAERAAANRLGKATANAKARIAAAKESMILTEDELEDIIETTPVEDQATAITKATADKLNREKTQSYKYKLDSDPKFRQKELEKQERRYQKALDRREAEKEAIVVRRAEDAKERTQRDSEHLSDYLLVADTESRTLQEWLFSQAAPNIHTIPELKDIHAAVMSLKQDGPGYKQWSRAWMEFIITRTDKPVQPDWYKALMELYYTPLTIPEHCDWINTFEYKEYTHEQTAANGRGVAHIETSRSFGTLQAASS